MNRGDHLFGGTLQPGGDTFIAIFSTEARATRYIAADPEPDPIEAFTACIEGEADLHEWLTDLEQSGRKHVVLNPIGPTVEPACTLAIRDLLAKLKGYE
jgi:hypothetical protein